MTNWDKVGIEILLANKINLLHYPCWRNLMAKQAKADAKKPTKSPRIDLTKVAEALRRIRNDSHRTHLMIRMINMEEEPKQLIGNANKYLNERCDELDQLLGTNTKIEI